MVLFIKDLKLQTSKMLLQADNKENVKYQFYRVSNSPNGLYALIDYVNFKGEGTSETERYNGQGWGLLQILENMKGKKNSMGLNSVPVQNLFLKKSSEFRSEKK